MAKLLRFIVSCELDAFRNIFNCIELQSRVSTCTPYISAKYDENIVEPALAQPQAMIAIYLIKLTTQS